MLPPGQGGSVGMNCGLILCPVCAGPPHPTEDPAGPAFANSAWMGRMAPKHNHQDGALGGEGGGQQAQKGATLSHGKGAGRGFSMRGLDQASGQASTSQARGKEGEEWRYAGISVGDCPGEKGLATWWGRCEGPETESGQRTRAGEKRLSGQPGSWGRP